MPETAKMEFLEFVIQMTADARKIALGRFGTAAVSRKADKSVVTEADHAAQAHVIQAIVEKYPDHTIWAEETIAPGHSLPSRQDTRFCWVIDPLDGTRNYTEGFRSFSTAIALLDRGVPIVAVVREHNQNQLFTAVRGGGFRYNGELVQAIDRPDGADILVAIPSSKDALAVRVVCNWSSTRGLIVRNLGSTALHMGMVASNVLGAVFSTRAKIWDIAAGVLLVTEAGGIVTSASGASLLPFDLSAPSQRDIPFLAAAPQTHARLLDSVRPDTPA